MEELKVNTGDILQVSSNTTVGSIIRWWMRGSYNHSAIFTIDIEELSEAAIDGIVDTHIKKYSNNIKYKLKVLKPKVKLTQDELVNLTDIINKYKYNTGYDFTNLLIHQPIKYVFDRITLIKIIGKIFGLGKWIGKSSHNADRKFACAEWVMFLYNNIRPYMFKEWYAGAPVDLDKSIYFDSHHVKIFNNKFYKE